ncbi:MAG: hypothetical protein ACI9WS_003330, partial [Paraglaciecola psychrophila]
MFSQAVFVIECLHPAYNGAVSCQSRVVILNP